MTDQPIFSICHATARPEQWKASYDDWWAKCDHPETVEYILGVDSRWGFDPTKPPKVGSRSRVFWCTGPLGAHRAWNEIAAVSKGKILIMNADDFRPPEHWDTKLIEALPQTETMWPDLDTEFVMEVSSGPLADNRRLMVLYILSRKRYEKLGYVLYPNYISLWVDNEFTEHARQDGVVIDARHLEFHHFHPHQGDGLFPLDAAYEAGNTTEAWNQGIELFNHRKALGFPAWLP